MYVCHVFVFYEKVKESKSEVKALKKSLILKRESEISVLEEESGCDIRKGKREIAKSRKAAKCAEGLPVINCIIHRK